VCRTWKRATAGRRLRAAAAREVDRAADDDPLGASHGDCGAPLELEPAAGAELAGPGSLGDAVVVAGGTGVFGAGTGTVVFGTGTGAGGAGSVGVRTVGTGTGGSGGRGTDGTVTVGTVGVGTVGVGTVGITPAAAVPAAAAAVTRQMMPQVARTPVQPRRGRTGFGLSDVSSAAESMRLEQDYYDVLGVTRGASDEEIKRAFRGLARRLHPDAAPEEPVEEERFHEVVAAYEVLSHPKRRRLYDRLGLGGRRQAAARPAPAVPPIELELEWYEAERGASKPVEFTETLACAACRGSGAAPGVVPAECVPCRGTGRFNRVTESPTLRLLEVHTCTTCEGRGHDVAPSCEACAGSGTTTSARMFSLRVPAGVGDGDLLQVDDVDQRFHLNVKPRPRDSRIVIAVAAAALVCAVGLLLYLTLIR
jgi:DnaJ domain/DnaJ central domain